MAERDNSGGRWLGLVVAALVASANAGGCSSEAVQTTGAGGDATVTTSLVGGMPVTTSTTVGGAGNGGGGEAGGGGSGGVGGAAPTWSEPPVHLEELCIGIAISGQFKAFTIPDNTFGFTLVGRVSNEDTPVGLSRLRPAGSSIIVDFDVAGKDFDSYVDLGVIAGANPQSDLPDAWPMHVGEWRTIFADDGSAGSVDVCVYARRSLDGLPHGGVMDVNVRIAPGAGVSNGYMQSVLDAMFGSFYEPNVGIGEGAVTFGALSDAFDTVSNGAELNALYRSSLGIGPRPAVNLFVVGDFSNGDFGGAIGIAGGIPGTPVVHGTAQSGVAYQPSGDASFDAAVLAHEIGHLGGLWHTTELQIAETDPLSDTPECSTIGSNPNSCPDVNNMMFPVAYGGTEITPDQRMVLAGSALYRGRVSEGGQPGAALPGGMMVLGGSWSGFAQTLAVRSRPVARDEVERLLSSVWCGRGGADHVALVHELASESRLLAIAGDEGAFDVARGRALDTLLRFVSDEAAVAALLVVASDIVARPSSGRMALLAAIDVLAAEDDVTLARAAGALHRRGDRLVSARLRARGL